MRVPDKLLPSRSDLRSHHSMLSGLWERMARAVNGRMSFGDGTSSDNIDGVWATPVTPGVANTDFTVTHNLGRIPSGFLVFNKSAACDVYQGSVAWTTSQITLRATVVGVTVKLFIM